MLLYLALPLSLSLSLSFSLSLSLSLSLSFSRTVRPGTWHLSRDLRLLREAKNVVRLLVIPADEGSTSWSLFNALAGHGFRVLFVRDTNHRLSNVFANTMRDEPAVLGCTFRVLTANKYCRAPYGGGRFLREAQASLRWLLQVGSAGHGVLDMFAERIAHDRQLDPKVVVGNYPLLTSIITDVAQAPIGSVVQLRRWWTYFDYNEKTFDRMWHTLLMGMYSSALCAGVSPADLLLVLKSNDAKSSACLDPTVGPLPCVCVYEPDISNSAAATATTSAASATTTTAAAQQPQHHDR
jgi:hypothetical protein